jgi:hypothetical protein
MELAEQVNEAREALEQNRDHKRPVARGEGRRRKAVESPARRMLRAIGQARQQLRGLPGAMPVNTGRAAKGHHAIGWMEQGRQRLVTRAIACGVVEIGKTREVVGKPGVGQYRTWKTLAAAVERAEQAGIEAR